MALDDLLAKLERNPALHDSGVTRVTGVTPSNGKGFAVTPTTCERVTGVTPGRADAGPVTPVTPTDDEGVTTKAAPILECTPVTPVTPQTDNGQGATARAWLLHFSDRDPMEVWTAPPATHDEILALYPDAVAAEPPLHTPGKGATSSSEQPEPLEMVLTIYADDTSQEAIGLARSDPDGALACHRATAAERGLSVPMQVSTGTAPVQACKSCRHLTRPGRAEPGYCDQRDDRHKAYGDGHPLRKLPCDQGATCDHYAPHE